MYQPGVIINNREKAATRTALERLLPLREDTVLRTDGQPPKNMIQCGPTNIMDVGRSLNYHVGKTIILISQSTTEGRLLYLASSFN